jgi:hypothetical protein
MRYGLLFRLTALTLISATLNGCLATNMTADIAQGEVLEEVDSFVLTASVNAYDITRGWGSGHVRTLSIPRRALPTDCESARFFLNDSAHELKIAEPARANRVTNMRPPLADGSFPPCALLVSYGTFAEPSTLEGVAVTSSTQLIATGERQQPQPVAWALVPVALVADIYIYIGAVLTLPIWAPIGYLWEKSAAKRKLKQKENERSVLPPLVAACWTTIDSEMKKAGPPDPDHKFTGFEWTPGVESAYAFITADEAFSDDKPVPIDARVTLRQGRVAFRSLWTGADAECGLRSGDVVATRVNLLK